MIRRRLPPGKSQLVNTLWSFRDSIINQQSSSPNSVVNSDKQADCSLSASCARKRSTSVVTLPYTSASTINCNGVQYNMDLTSEVQGSSSSEDNDVNMDDDDAADRHLMSNKRLRLSSYQQTTDKLLQISAIMNMVHNKRSIRMSTYSNSLVGSNGQRKLKKTITSLHNCTIERCFGSYLQKTFNQLNHRTNLNRTFRENFSPVQFTTYLPDRTSITTTNTIDPSCAGIVYNSAANYAPNNEFSYQQQRHQQNKQDVVAEDQQQWEIDILNDNNSGGIHMSNEVAEYVMSEHDTLFWEVPSDTASTTSTSYPTNASSSYNITAYNSDEQQQSKWLIDISRNTINSCGSGGLNRSSANVGGSLNPLNSSYYSNSRSARKCQEIQFDIDGFNNRWAGNDYTRAFPNWFDTFGNGCGTGVYSGSCGGGQQRNGGIITGKAIFASEDIINGNYRMEDRYIAVDRSGEDVRHIAVEGDCYDNKQHSGSYGVNIDKFHCSEDILAIEEQVDLLESGYSHEELEDLLFNKCDSNNCSVANDVMSESATTDNDINLESKDDMTSSIVNRRCVSKNIDNTNKEDKSVMTQESLSSLRSSVTDLARIAGMA
ncbi:hypothetical protein GJ496_002321 [Pomphorhynchus laevis]|nr:hypothetical protein GJ496_002321 [Pomphorhynchus laevis]